jgi:hypothetical protein
VGRIHIILIVLFIAAGCKVQKRSTTASRTKQLPVAATDTIRVAQIDSSNLEITEVVEVQDTVEIGMFRVIKDTLTVIGVGDIMLGTNYPKEHYLPPDSGKYLLNEVYDLLNDADLTFGNLEGVILNDGGTPKNCKNPKACYLFRSPEYLARYLLTGGFDVLSLANNHKPH